MTDADEKVAALLLKMFKTGYGDTQGLKGSIKHLRQCDTAWVQDVDGGDSFYGCETGCEYVRIKASVKCKCGHLICYRYDDFGDMEGLFMMMDRM